MGGLVSIATASVQLTHHMQKLEMNVQLLSQIKNM